MQGNGEGGCEEVCEAGGEAECEFCEGLGAVLEMGVLPSSEGSSMSRHGWLPSSAVAVQADASTDGDAVNEEDGR